MSVVYQQVGTSIDTRVLHDVVCLCRYSVSYHTLCHLHAAFPNRDFNFTTGTRIVFTDVETPQSLSSNELVVPIINDDIAEPCESFICTLQGGALDAIRGIEPNRVTIQICDDDGELMSVLQCCNNQ